MASTARGHFVWHELLTTDPRSATAFYGKVAGWSAKAWDADPGYLVLMTGDSPMGGVLALPPDAQRKGEPRRWLPYIGTEDVEVGVWEAQRLGLDQPLVEEVQKEAEARVRAIIDLAREKEFHQ